MSARRDVPVLDRFRLLAAFLAVCNHTAPLAGLAPEADFWLTRVLARIAVPFFLMVSGYFLSRDGWRGTGRFLKRTLTLYAAAVLLYLPLNWYNGGFSPLEWLKKLLIDGTLYHLWYFPAVLLGVVIARGLARLGLPAALAAALLLYLIGLGGDSYCPPWTPSMAGCSACAPIPGTGCSWPPFSCFWGRRESGWAGGSPPWAPFSPWPVCPWRRSGSAPRAGPATTACIFSSP